MAVYIFRREQLLKGVRLDEAWEFFSNPINLKKITPDYMGFNIISSSNSNEMYAGQIIRYLVKPFANIPMHWTTEITQVNEPEFFIDEQRLGPYKIWHHQHKFREVSGGVVMEDIVHYAPPFGIFGRLANKLFIQRKLHEIFDYRKKVIREIFGFSE